MIYLRILNATMKSLQKIHQYSRLILRIVCKQKIAVDIYGITQLTMIAVNSGL